MVNINLNYLLLNFAYLERDSWIRHGTVRVFHNGHARALNCKDLICRYSTAYGTMSYIIYGKITQHRFKTALEFCIFLEIRHATVRVFHSRHTRRSTVKICEVSGSYRSHQLFFVIGEVSSELAIRNVFQAIPCSTILGGVGRG